MSGHGDLSVVLCLWLFFVFSTAYYFEPGFDHHYTYSSKSNLLGLHDITTIIKFRVSAVNTTNDVNGKFHRLHMDSFIQHSQTGYMADNPKKWNMTRSFLFQMSREGLVTFVHYHPEDHDEIVTLKKVIASVLSANTKKFRDDNVDVFIAKEIDHTGNLEHRYEMSRNAEGLKVRRIHQSSENVHRLHNKTLLYDEKGTVQKIIAEDNIRLRSSEPQKERTLMAGEFKIEDTASGDFPVISSSSITQIKLTNKRRLQYEDTHDPTSANGLISDILIIVEKPKRKKELSEVNESMEGLLKCIHAHENKFAPNRTECVTQLRDIFTSQLNDVDYKMIAENTLDMKCDTNGTLCQDHRNLFIDLISRKGDNESQAVMIKYFLKAPDAKEKEIQRCLIHCIALQNPLKELVEDVEELCFGKENILHGSERLEETQRRACLTLGALAKTIQHSDSDAAHRIVGKLEAWLDYHNDTKSNRIIKPRMKRSVTKVDHNRLHHIVTKMVLLHALGNAGMSRSINHILSYMQPKKGTLAWRRAAVHGLRYFKCNKSADALFMSSIQDDSDIVRDMAYEFYQIHPKGSKNLTEYRKNIILGQRYTYPVLMRLKRGIFDVNFKNGLYFAINIPGIDWQKTIGTKDIGASLGLVIRNKLELELKPLKGHFDVDVYDTAYAEAHVGLINLKVDIFRALLCYKGHMGYDLNILKDFGINQIQDLVHIFDRVVAKVVDPIKQAVERFKQLINTFKDGGIQKLFDKIVGFIKQLPEKLKAIAEKFVQFVLEAVDFSGFPIIQKIKNIVVKIRTFIEDVQEDVLGFYHNIVDAVTVTLPYVGKSFMDAIATIVSSMKNLLRNPMQSLTGLGESILKIKMALSMFIDVKNQILDACFFSKGKTPFWLTLGTELFDIIASVKELINSISVPGGLPIGSSSKSGTAVSDGIVSAEEQFQKIKDKLKSMLTEIFTPLSGTTTMGNPFFDTFKSVMDVVQGVKLAYEFLRDVVQKGRSMVQKVFGPKFDRSFPKRRREENEPCGQGIWPTTTNGLYKTTGVDVLRVKGSPVPMPVNGMVFRKSRRQVLIQPKGGSLNQYEIVIDNIIPERFVGSSGAFVKSGKTIGKADVSKCQPNFIHVAMRKRGVQQADDADYDYVDPSTYLDRSLPIPQWIEECNDHYFKHLGQIFESGSVNKKGAKETKEKIKRNDGVKNKIKEFESMDPGKQPVYHPGGIDSSAANSVTGGFKDSLNSSLGSFGDTGNLYTGSKAPNIVDFFDINKFTIQKISGIIGDKSLTKQLDSVVETLSEVLKKAPVHHPEGISIPNLRRLAGRMVKSVVGDRFSMISSLLSSAEKDCPTFNGSLAKGFGHVCSASRDCQGLTCGISLPFGAVNKIVKADIKVDKCDKKIHIASSVTATVELDGVDHQINLGNDIHEGLSAKVVVNGEIKNGRVLLSLDAMLCSDTYSSCLPDIQVLTDVAFPDPGSCKADAIQDTGKGNVYAMTLKDFQTTLSQYHLLDRNILLLFNNIRDVALQELMKDPRKLFSVQGTEFPDKMDLCISKNLPVDPFDITFFEQRYLFMIGPVPLGLGFGAGGSIGVEISLGFCFMSLKAKAKVTPLVGGKVWGDLAVDIVIARGGIRLEGWLLESRFPITASIGFSKFPLDMTAQMDLFLTPVRLDLKAFAELKLLFTTVTIFEGSIWKYKAPTIHRNIFKTNKKGKDTSPPEFKPSTVNNRRKREGPRGCILKQLAGRNPVDTAFMLEVATEDEVSDVKMFYAIGTQRGGTNVVDWTEMGGASLVVPIKLPGGIPLYWTVKAGNSQGLFAYAHCMLHTFDSTIPDGRVDSSYPYSSHPNRISGTVVVFDDSQLVDPHFVAIGYSPGQFGSEFMSWDPLTTLQSTKTRYGVNNDLKYFRTPYQGKLTSIPIKTVKTEHDFLCARECVNYGTKCVSFDFEYHTEICDLQEFVQGPNAKLRVSGTYKNYERLGVGSSSFVSYRNLNLSHGTSYYINVEIRNILGYKAYLISKGTIIDFTPPETGPLGNGYTESMHADGCKAAISQRCVEVTWMNNHRKIIDGKDAKTVFNGHIPLEDTMYTLANHYASVNFDGFRDNETGIWGYTWAVGRSKCGSDIVTFRDPHAHLSSPKYWTNTGYIKGIQMEDGPYYVTVQSLNNIVYGGALVTTVCHSTPFIVDTTPPVFGGITEIFYDEDFDILAVYYKASDPLSKIARIDFGLGKNKYDVSVRSYSQHAYVDSKNPFVAIKDLGLEEGVPAWIRLRAVNNVNLFTSGHGDEPILIDRSSPIPGSVSDGDLLRGDIQYQSDTTKICAQWKNFHDPESGILNYVWGVGTLGGKDDIVEFHNLTHHQREACADVSLQHNKCYYSTVVAFNSALNSKQTTNASNGVLVDITPPLPGWVKDGKFNFKDMNFSSESATKNCHWGTFSDPESHINGYEVSVYINSEIVKLFDVNLQNSLYDHSIAMKHLDEVEFEVTATDGAGLTTSVKSNGFLVDHTPPVIAYLKDTINGAKYQPFDDKLKSYWKYDDAESGIKEYRYYIIERKRGLKSRFWPKHEHYQTVFPLSNFQASVSEEIQELKLSNGAKYSFHVTSINGALITTSHESEGVTVDTTPPTVSKVHIGLPKEEENLDENGTNILHADPTGITVSWKGRDPESGISNFYVAMGTAPLDTSVTGDYLDFGTDISAHISGLALNVSSETNIYYFISVKAKNGAGAFSDVTISKRIIIQKSNVPGIIYDGRDDCTDKDYTVDKTSLALTFGGFESEACNIVSYEWAIGSEPYQSDVMPYTDYGLVRHNDSHGHAQVHVQLYEDIVYYTSVRAKTGHDCHDEYIVSTSDGIKLDTKIPVINFIGPETNDTRYVEEHELFFQSFSDSVDLTWNFTDQSPTAAMIYSLGSLPFREDIHYSTSTRVNRLPLAEASLMPGKALFMNLQIEDQAGNIGRANSFPVMSDISAPVIHKFTCTPFISFLKTSVSCNWHNIEEFESRLKSTYISLGSFALGEDLHQSVFVPFRKRSWTRDMQYIIQNNNITEVYVTMQIKNILNIYDSVTFAITVDRTPPDTANIEFVTRIDNKENNIKQLCQVPSSYVEISVKDLKDAESGIDRVEVCLGTSREQSDIKDFHFVSTKSRVFIGGLALKDGSHVYATARIYNKAGLYSLVTSDPIVVSQNPTLSVIDGPDHLDLDYQSELNELQGKWFYSDPCPILIAEWAVEDITGNVLQEFQQIQGNLNFFYNDELKTQNGFLYINKIRTKDALNRIKEANSNGIAVRIQTPNPGNVRDGLDIDINYQRSVQVLSANWDNFGMKDSKDPTQTIVRYEVAIGNDRRQSKTRSNVHYFVDVGLNTSYTFKNLNLTSKIVNYFFTVRAYSQAGSFEEGYSNGVIVGIHDEIVPGKVEVLPYQFDTHTISVSWSGFESNIGIKYYQVAISTKSVIFLNGSISCEEVERRRDKFDTHTLTNVGLNTYIKMRNLTLRHSTLYYPTVVAVDESDMCLVVTGSPLLIDTSPPDTTHADIHLDGKSTKGKELVYITDLSRLFIHWSNVSDSESGIDNAIISFEGINGCPTTYTLQHPDFKVTEIKVVNDNEISLYDLGLFPEKYYFIKLSIQNRAGLQSAILSPVLLVDTTPPFVGSVKIGNNWSSKTTFQYSDKELHAFTAVARSEAAYICPNQMSLFPADSNSVIRLDILRGDYAPDNVEYKSSSVILKVGYDIPLIKVVKGGIQSGSFALREGNYTFRATSASGKNIVTAFAVASLPDVMPDDFIAPEPDNFEKPDFNFSRPEYSDTDENITFFTDNISESTTSIPLSSTIKSTNSTKHENNDTHYVFVELENDNRFGFGINILGQLQKNAKKWDCLFWALDRYKNVKQWITLDFDPTETNNEFIFQASKETNPSTVFWNIALILNGEMKSTIDGMQFPSDVQIYSQTWNKDNYEEPISDPFDPFRSQAEIFKISLPRDIHKQCLYGSGFYDGDSGIQEMWVGVSDSLNETDNIFPLRLHKTYCLPCNGKCNFGCDTNCTDSGNLTEFEIDEINIEHLSLETTKLDSDTSMDHTSVNQTHTYYVNVKIKNFAGKEVLATSNAVMVDRSPPFCEYVHCVDPNHSLDEPVEYLGSNSSIGAYWSCHEDISDIKRYVVSVGTDRYKSDMFNETNFGLQTRIHLNLTDTYFEHGVTYHLNLKVINTADQTSNFSCRVKAELYPPNITVEAQPMYLVNSKESELDSSLTEFSDRAGVQWNNKEDNVAFYEWKIGTDTDTDNIIPRIKVGVSKIGNATIFQGHLIISGTYMNKSVSDIAESKNWTGEDLNDINKDSTFYMEPGRCLHHSLYAVGRSHISTQIPMEPTCVTRPEDLIIVFNSTQKFEITKRSRSGSSFKVENGNGIDKVVSINITGDSGGVIFGHLESEDLLQDYGTAASDKFNPFIVDPERTKHLSSITLRDRLISYQGLSFFMAPASEVSVQNIEMSAKYDQLNFETDTVPALAFWNPDTTSWIHVAEGCTEDLIGQNRDSVHTNKVCLKNLQNNFAIDRRKRSAKTTISKPTMFSLFKMKGSCSNRKPVIDDELIEAVEDTRKIHKIKWHDGDIPSDSVVFTLSKGSEHGSQDITPNGTLSFMPASEFAGTDKIIIILTEVNTSCHPYSVNKTITINVLDVNDPPVSGFLTHNGLFYNTSVDNKVMLTFEGNNTAHYIGRVIISDVDMMDTLTLKSKYPSPNNNGRFTIYEQFSSVLPNGTYSSNMAKSFKLFNIYLNVSKQYHGELQFQILGHDKGTLYTQRVDLHVFILWTPCVHGRCSPRSTIKCDDVIRASTFDPYVCICDPGYEHDYCQNEIDECRNASCPLMYNCVDNLASYECIINPVKLLAILTCVTIAFGVLALLIWRRIKRQHARNKIANSSFFTEHIKDIRITSTLEQSSVQGHQSEIVDQCVYTSDVSPDETKDGILASATPIQLSIDSVYKPGMIPRPEKPKEKPDGKKNKNSANTNKKGRLSKALNANRPRTSVEQANQRRNTRNKIIVVGKVEQRLGTDDASNKTSKQHTMGETLCVPVSGNSFTPVDV